MSDSVVQTALTQEEGPVARIEVQPLGAGQDVGRSCIMLKFVGRFGELISMVMLDCGLHVGFDDPSQAFPDFSKVDLKLLDAVLVTHYHIDHCGALPTLTERAKYEGLVVVSPPTKALLPMMLEDQLSDRSFNEKDIQASVDKCTVVEARQTLTIKPNLEVTSFRAGHVLGAVIFHIKCFNASAIYTGDYNATPDRHLGAFEYCPLPPGATSPDLVITESTYGTTTRGSQRSSEREFLDQVHSCLLRGGKVLVPTFALGRVQEIVSLLESHWDRMNLAFPIFLCTIDAAKVANIYQFYEGWGSSRVPAEAENTAEASWANDLSRKYIRTREPTLREIEEPGPLVLLATAAMLAGGLSVRAFRCWAGDEKNAVVFPGHCVRGTLGYTLLSAKEKAQKGESITLKMSNRPKDELTVRCAVSTAPFSAHTDSKGILQFIHQVKPANVILVHGVKVQMEALRRRIERELPFLQGHVFFPENLEVVKLSCNNRATVQHDNKRLKSSNINIELLRGSKAIPTSAFASLEAFKLEVRFRIMKALKEAASQNSTLGSVTIADTLLGLRVSDGSVSLELQWSNGSIECVTYSSLGAKQATWEQIVEGSF